ncbi:MAG TPA: cytochrome c oxidase subunit 3 [Polyangiaceae bacterium]
MTSSTGSTLGRFSTRQLGLFVLMVSMSVLFTASLVAYLWTRLANEVWKTPEMPELPLGLFGSTAMLAGLSAAMHRAVSDVRKNKDESLVRDLWLACAFAGAFLLGQVFNWGAMVPGLYAPVEHPLYPFTFYMLTGLHAAHVLGGFIPLGIVIVRAQRRRYSSSEYEGVRLVRQYWDYLGVVWLVLLATMWIAT